MAVGTATVVKDASGKDRCIVSELATTETDADLLTRGILASMHESLPVFRHERHVCVRDPHGDIRHNGIKNVDGERGGNTVTGAGNAVGNATSPSRERRLRLVESGAVV